jgi:hypothetical protein
MTLWASALHIAVGEEAVAAVAEGQGHSVLIDIAFILEGAEEVMDCLGMVLRPGRGEQVKGDAQPLPAVEELLMIAAYTLLRAYPLPFSGDGNRCSMLVTP